MTKEAIDIQKEIEKYFTESAGFGRDKIQNFMDIVNKALKQKGEQIAELEKENAELKTDYKVLICSVGDFGELQEKLEEEQRKNNGLSDNLTKATDLLKKVIKVTWGEGWNYSLGVKVEAEQFLNEDKAETSEEPYYVIMNMNCQYEICRMCPKSGLFKGTYEECENWIKEKLSEVEK